jgi:hypothetical protein
MDMWKDSRGIAFSTVAFSSGILFKSPAAPFRRSLITAVIAKKKKVVFNLITKSDI